MKQETIQYRGYNDFKCTADKCRHTCCMGWQINIDDKTYKKYEDSTYLKKDMSLNFIKGRNEEEGDIISMKLTKDGFCTFLQKDFLCELHSKCGEDFLCDTCRIYPRGINVVGKVIEKHLYSSCPAMVEGFLLNNDKLTFEMLENDYDKEEIDKTIEFESEIEEQLFKEIRGFTIEALQSDYISFEEKFIVIGLAYSNFDPLMTNREFEEVRRLIAIYTEMIEDSSIIPQMEATSMHNEIKTVVLDEISKFNLEGKLEEILVNLLNVLDESANGIDGKFKEKYDLYEKNNSVYIQNYLVNAVYSSGTPFTSYEVMDSYTLLVIKYMIFKTYMKAVKEDIITDENFVDIVALSSRSFDHNKMGVDVLISELQILSKISGDVVGVLVNLIR
ncbi:flagellin lysine-N-methylase [uncultured Clostridium sp.]|uniref:flagellin lysine-N-methylase n=1 Tax=uncultured Clostridium sp. TaxID=59620 RepID=UPI002621F0E6|nr:flagellin lysine-N-methylase [uncultured Clostridium sp.]